MALTTVSSLNFSDELRRPKTWMASCCTGCWTSSPGPPQGGQTGAHESASETEAGGVSCLTLPAATVLQAYRLQPGVTTQTSRAAPLHALPRYRRHLRRCQTPSGALCMTPGHRTYASATWMSPGYALLKWPASQREAQRLRGICEGCCCKGLSCCMHQGEVRA